MPGFDPRSLHVTPVTYKLALNESFPQYSAFPPSVPFHHCFTLIFPLILLLSEGQMSDAWEPSNTAQSFLIFGRKGQKRTLLSSIRIVNSVQACANVFETREGILWSNCVKWEGGINYVRININFLSLFFQRLSINR
jgi:hypothetical protein